MDARAASTGSAKSRYCVLRSRIKLLTLGAITLSEFATHGVAESHLGEE